MEYLWWLKSDMQLKVIASNYNIYHVSRAIWERNYYAFEKLHITPETESPKENSDKLNNALKTMVLDSINKLRVKKKKLKTLILISYQRRWLQTLMKLCWQISYRN